tara:strand:- start:835 stop:1272 length:438 start_codon:yes stop_codon:yes gene_type:complete
MALGRYLKMGRLEKDNEAIRLLYDHLQSIHDDTEVLLNETKEELKEVMTRMRAMETEMRDANFYIAKLEEDLGIPPTTMGALAFPNYNKIDNPFIPTIPAKFIPARAESKLARRRRCSRGYRKGPDGTCIKKNSRLKWVKKGQKS